MVAYSFKKMFVPAIQAGTKRQTVRPHRKRHARPGEAVQLYCGMRTRNCFKILEPDPICTAVHEIFINVGGKGLVPSFEIIENGISLLPPSVEAFAKADGFEDAVAMRDFWLKNHGRGRFEGVVIYWSVFE